MSLIRFTAVMLICLLAIAFADDSSNALKFTISAPQGVLDSSSLQITATLTNTSAQDINVIQVKGDVSVIYGFVIHAVHDNLVQPPKDNGFLSQ